MNRRDFLSALGAAGLAYGFRLGSGTGTTEDVSVLKSELLSDVSPAVDYTHWIKFNPNGTVQAFSGRAELGQGLLTVLYSILSRGLDLPRDKIEVILGDTARCPDDGATGGSTTTAVVGWGFWQACLKIHAHIVKRGAAALGVRESQVRYKDGKVFAGNSKSISVFELQCREAVLMNIDTEALPPAKNYTDPGFQAVLGRQIVTGELQFAGDLKLKNMKYGAFLTPPYHKSMTKLLSAKLRKARKIDGVVSVEKLDDGVAVVAENYPALQRALSEVNAKWSVPSRGKKFNNFNEILQGAKYVRTIKKDGNLQAGLNASDFVLSETYSTQYATHSPIETDTAVADAGGENATVWVGTQYAAGQRRRVKDRLNFPIEKVRVVGMPAGGAFGGKINNFVAPEAASISRHAGHPIKYIYNRSDQFTRRGVLKTSVIVKIKTGTGSNGRIEAQEMNIYQDSGGGITDVYEIPNFTNTLYNTQMPTDNVAMRAVSYVPDVFALESHIDQVAHGLGMDPLEFRLKNLEVKVMKDCLQACAEMFGYANYKAGKGRGVGMASAHWGGSSFAGIMVEVQVDRSTGKVRVERVCFAADIGLVISKNTAIANIQGGIIFGLGYALMEEAQLDGHSIKTKSMSRYKIPRFEDTPIIEIKLLNSGDQGGPHGCGELPVVPTAPAIANAVYNATGVRLYQTPITPSRLKKALK